MRLFLIAILFASFLLSCGGNVAPSKYMRWVGDAAQDPNIDKPEFSLCYGERKVKQYFNFSQGLQFDGEKKRLKELFYKKFEPTKSNQSGWIRIRFIVNCRGQSGRFRILSANENYEEQEFDQEIINQLLEITKSLDGWKLLPNTERPEDYYQYLIFKLKNGNLEEILP